MLSEVINTAGKTWSYGAIPDVSRLPNLSFVLNLSVIKKFLAQQKGVEEIKINADWGVPRPFGQQVFPEVQGMDGFYYAKLLKKA